jgi:hypothetical protein
MIHAPLSFVLSQTYVLLSPLQLIDQFLCDHINAYLPVNPQLHSVWHVLMGLHVRQLSDPCFSFSSSQSLTRSLPKFSAMLLSCGQSYTELSQ